MYISYWVNNLFLCSQFQYGGDSQKGPVISAQEAQAQAILQQTKVRHTNQTVFGTYICAFHSLSWLHYQ